MNRWQPDVIELPCGSWACFDVDSGMGYRCMRCEAMVGSVGQPDHCKEEAEKWKVNKLLGGMSWEEYLRSREE
ncbi:MAG TPA: hypothetical protein VFM18_18170 [Methanosarcina sp.]|nr:hypothetical protein [Methanosarcina sp.]